MLRIGLPEPVMKLMGQRHAVIDLRILGTVLCRPAEEQAESQNASVQGAAHTAGSPGADRHSGRHRDDLLRYVHLEIAADRGHDGFTAEEAPAVQILRMFLDRLWTDLLCVIIHHSDTPF